jgi:ABC-type transport system involved in multi-copper enzyme maturation permease subunit
MGRLENPVLKRELKDRIRGGRFLRSIAIRVVLLGFIFYLVLLSRLGKGLLAFILAEAVLILLYTPGAIHDAFASNAGRGQIRELTLTRLSPRAILLGKFAGASFYNLIIILISALAMFRIWLFCGGFHLWRLVYANLALLILLYASAVISLAFSSMFRRSTLIPAILAYTLILLLMGSIVAAGPVIDGMDNPRAKTVMITLALYANPLVMASRTLGTIDIMRTEYMYRIADPIAGRGFTYPNWYFAAIIYFTISCALLLPVYLRFSRIRRSPDPLVSV